MKSKKNLELIACLILAGILGMATFRQIDFENLSFKNLGLGIIYLLSFLFMVFLIVRGRKLKKQ